MECIVYIIKVGDLVCIKIIFKEVWMLIKLNNSYFWDCKENKKGFCKLFISDKGNSWYIYICIIFNLKFK